MLAISRYGNTGKTGRTTSAAPATCQAVQAQNNTFATAGKSRSFFHDLSESIPDIIGSVAAIVIEII
jgi:hypothetical protein